MALGGLVAVVELSRPEAQQQAVLQWVCITDFRELPGRSVLLVLLALPP
jgi:hypothetical protein